MFYAKYFSESPWIVTSEQMLLLLGLSNNNNEKKRKGKSSTVYKIFGKFTVSVQDPFTTSEIGPDI